MGLAGAGQVEDGVLARGQQLVGAPVAHQVGGLAVAFQHRGEAHRAGRQLHDVTGDGEVHRRRRGRAFVDHARGEALVDLRGNRIQPVVHPDRVDRVAGRVPLDRAQEVIVHGLGQQARAIGGVVVLAVREACFPVERAKHALRAGLDGPGLLVVQGRGGLFPTQLERLEDALHLQEVAQVGLIEERRCRTVGPGGEAVAGGAPELGAGAGLRLVGVIRQAGEQLGVFAQVQGAVGVAAVELLRVEQRARGGVGVRTAVGAARRGGDRGVAEAVARRLVVHDHVVQRDRAAAGDVPGSKRQRRVDRQAVRVVAHVGGHVPLVGEHRLVLGVLQRVQDAPVVAGLAAGELEVGALAAAVFGGADGRAHLVAVEILAGDHVDHARDRVGPVDRRGAAGHDFGPLDDRGRDGADVGDVVVAVVRLRVLRRATAVDQHQGVARAERAQVDHLGVGGEAADGHVAGEAAGGALGQGLQHVGDRLVAFEVDLLAGDHGHRRGRFDGRALDARADHGHLVEGGVDLPARRGLRGLLLVLVPGLLGRGALGHREAGEDQGREQRRGQRIAGEAGARACRHQDSPWK